MNTADSMSWFPADYYAARTAFRDAVVSVQARWPAARPGAYALPDAPELTIDWVLAPPPTPERLLVLTTGQHGIEGFVGAAVMRLFLAEYLPRLDPDTTGLLLVQTINPWGMAHKRRVNARNVDLNRNFIWEPGDGYSPDANPDYRRVARFLNPARPLKNRLRSELAFLAGLAGGLARLGQARLAHTILQGQYYRPQGLYFGGFAPQVETDRLARLLRETYAGYPQVLHIDNHTGYGPSDRMTLVNSIYEPRSPAEWAARSGYPWVARTDPESFYPIQGDMVDYLYRLARTELPDLRLYATAFEFGTVGQGLAASLKSLRAMILENQLAQYGCANPDFQAWIERQFMELYCPSDPAWRQNALAQARQAFEGILASEGYLRDG